MEEVFSSMQKAGIPINSMVGEILIEVCSCTKQFERTEGVMKIMDDTPGVQYGSPVHSLVIDSYASDGKLDEMEAAITRMFQNKRIFLTPKSLHASIMAYSRAGEYDRLAKAMEVVMGAGWITPVCYLQRAHFRAWEGGSPRQDGTNIRELVDANIKFSFENFQYIIDAHEADGVCV